MPTTRVDPSGLYSAPHRLSQVVLAEPAGLAFVAGQVDRDQHSGEIVGRTHVEQAAGIARNIAIVLEHLGLTADAILAETVYIVDRTPGLSREVLRALRESVSAPPASTCIGVQCLYRPEALVEVTVTIALGARPRPSAPRG